MRPEDHENVENERHYESMLKEIASIDPDNLYSLVPGSRLHQRINRSASEDSDQNL